MTLTLGMFNVMEYLWDTLEKTPDGKFICYTPLDVEMLWKMGFVDTKVYSLEEWKRAFDPYLRQDGTFLLSKDTFLSLDKYRYKGEIHIPFDAMRINEGLYTDEGFLELFELSIGPSCSFSPEQLDAFYSALKETHRTPEGLIRIGAEAKLKIKEIVEKNPSPLRNLEILFDKMIAQGEAKVMGETIEGMEADHATARAAVEASYFTSSPLSQSEAAARELKGIERVKEKDTAVASKSPVALKKIRRSRKGMRG